MKKIIFILLILALLVTGCSNTETAYDEQDSEEDQGFIGDLDQELDNSDLDDLDEDLNLDWI
tara:strand:- start:840 stop:1025 length:186 start_codon:yes stop_codon:yes gene_type:complete